MLPAGRPQNPKGGRPRYDKRKAPGWFSRAPVEMMLSQSWATASDLGKPLPERGQTHHAHSQQADRSSSIGNAGGDIRSDSNPFPPGGETVGKKILRADRKSTRL